MLSMTGIGVATAKAKDLSANVTVRAVNSRYLDLRLYLPDQLQLLESDVRKIVSEKMKRGTVSVSVELASDAASGLEIDFEKAKKFYEQAKILGKKLKLDTDITLDSIVKTPDLFKSNSPVLSDAQKKLVVGAVDEAVDSCNKERKREGQATLVLFKSLLADLKDHIEFVQKRAHPEGAEVTKKILERLEKLGLKGEIDPGRIAQEVVMQLEKADVSEEVERILEHLNGMGKAILSTDPVGKKLEFYTQELFREFNTVGSKSQDAEVTKVMIESKVIIERLREQVQNIE